MLCQNKFFTKKRKVLAKAAEPNCPGLSKGELAQNRLQTGILPGGPYSPGAGLDLGSQEFVAPSLVLQGQGPTPLCGMEIKQHGAWSSSPSQRSCCLRGGQGWSHLIHG